MGFKVSIGTVVWNQVKELLTNDETKTRLIYSSNIENKQFVLKNYSNPEKKSFINKKGLSKKTYAMSMIGDAHIHIDYSSPKVRGRIIFGGLLPFNEVWQSGAHMATSIETNKKLMINNQILDEGKYEIFTIPSKKNWTFIINKN